MTGFFSPFYGRAINIAHIREISPLIERPGKPSVHRIFVSGSDNFAHEATEGQVEELMKRAVQMIPAEPGTRLLWAGVDEGEGPWSHDTLLIAWAFCMDGLIRPVTPAGVDDGCREPTYGWWVKPPSGQIYSMSDDAMAVDDEEGLKRLVARMKASDDGWRARAAERGE